MKTEFRYVLSQTRQLRGKWSKMVNIATYLIFMAIWLFEYSLQAVFSTQSKHTACLALRGPFVEVHEYGRLCATAYLCNTVLYGLWHRVLRDRVTV